MKLGYAHPSFLLAELTSAQVADWIAFARICPDLRDVIIPTEADIQQQQQQQKRANLESMFKRALNKVKLRGK